MALPKSVLPVKEIELSDGAKVSVRGLSRGEFVDIAKRADGDPVEAEKLVLAVGTDTPEDEAREWYDNSLTGDVGLVVELISELSGMSPKVNS